MSLRKGTIIISGTSSSSAATWGNITGTLSDQSDLNTALNNKANSSSVTAIEGKIPNQATSSNQLADKNFVNSSINSVTAYYITKNAAGDQFATKAELNATTTFYSGGEVRIPTRNDYCIVLADETKTDVTTGENPTTRYIYQNNQWEFQYIVNKTSLTASQLSAVNSGITSGLVTQIGTNTSNITSLQTNKQDKLTSQTSYSNKGSATKVPKITTNNLGQVTSISEVTITQPTVNDATLTIKRNNTSVGTFTANASSNKDINITVPTKTSDLTNDSSFLDTSNIKATTTTSANDTYSCNFINSLILSANNYIKFDNGIMIQWKKVTFTPSMAQWGGLYYYDKDLGNWDIPFISLLSVFGNMNNDQYWCSGICLTSNTAIGKVRIYRQINIVNYEVDVYAVGIGTWK